MDLKLKFTAKPKDVIMFLIFCIFLLYIVAIGVLNLYEIANNNRFSGLNPFPAFGEEFLTTTLTLYLVSLLGIFLSTSSYFFDREKGFGFGKKKEKEDPGWARWFKDEEMKDAYSVKCIKLKDENYSHAGIPIIIDNKRAWVDDGENHSLIIGASGSGKTWTIIDPQVKILAKAGESMVVTDPKGEIYENNANLLRERGYNVVLVNFVDPENGNAWNPLTLPYRFYKDGVEDKAMELLEDIAMNILVDSNAQNDPFWQKSAADYFTGLAIGLFEDAKSEYEVNLNSINSMSTFGDERCGASKYDKEYFKLKGELSSAYISASATILAPSETKGGITSTFRQKIRIFSSRLKLAEMLSYTDFDVSKIGKEKTAVFLKIHDEKTTYHALATIFIKQVYESLIAESRKEDNLKLKVRTNFILDEFANMPALRDVESMVTASRSRNIRFTFCIQNFSQLNKVYGKEVAETIKGNCGNMFYLITTEYSALEEISKLLGDVKPKEAKDGKPQPPIRPLVTVSDLQQMKKFEMIIKRWRNHPYKTKHTPSFEILKNGGWGYEQIMSDYPVRETREIQVFDIKKFVDESKQGEEGNSGFSPFGAPQFTPPFGMPNMSSIPGMSGMSSGGANNVDDLVKEIDARIAKLEEEERQEKEKSNNATNDFENLVNKKYEEFTGASSNELKEDKPIVEPEKVEPQFNNTSNSINVDDLIKRIDAKIAELEKEELNNANINNEPKQDDFMKFINAVNNSPKEEISEAVKLDEPVEVKEAIIDNFEDNISTSINVNEIEKPKINVDVDSIIVNDKLDDDEFFDDFFGDDE